MKKIKVLILALFIIGIFSSSCVRYASQEQLNALEKACDAATAAEKRVEELKAEKAQLEKDIAAKNQVLDKLTRDRDAIR